MAAALLCGDLFPGSALAQGKSPPAARGAVPAAGPTQGAPITIQPNIGSFDDMDAQAEFSADGTYLAVNERSLVKLWDIATGRPFRALEHFAYFSHILFLGDGSQILTAHKDGTFRLWQAVSGKLLHEAKLFTFTGGDRFTSLRLHRGGKLVIASTFEGNVVVWDWDKRQRVHRYRFAGTEQNFIVADDAILSADGTTVTTAGEKLLTQYDLRTRKTIRKAPLPARDGSFNARFLDDRTLLIRSATDACPPQYMLIDAAGSPTATELDALPSCEKSDQESEPRDDEFGHVYREASGQLYLTRKGQPGVKTFDVASRRPGTPLTWRQGNDGRLIAISRDGTLAALATQEAIRIVRFASGETVSTLRSHGASGRNSAVSSDGQQMALHTANGKDQKFTIWPINGGAPSFQLVRLPPGQAIWDFSITSGRALAFDEKGSGFVYSLQDGREVGRFSIQAASEVIRGRLSPDGTLALVLAMMAKSAAPDDVEWTVHLVDIGSGKSVLAIPPRTIRTKDGSESDDRVVTFGFAPDGKYFAIGLQEGSAEIWSVETRALVKALQPAGDQTTTLSFSPNGNFLLGGSRDSGVFIWDRQSGKLMKELDRTGVAGHVSTGGLAMSDDGELIAAGPLQRAVSSGDVGRERGVQVWDASTGRMRFILRGHENNVASITFTKDKRWIVTGSIDGTIRYWDRKTGKLGATFATSDDQQWVIVTEPGFFAASSLAGDLLSVVRGFEVVAIDQLWQSLYAPDLVRSFIAGDPEGEVKTAAAIADLPAILASGPAPGVTLLPSPEAADNTSDVVTVSARIEDRGKGVGRVEWRLNGVTAAVIQSPAGTSGQTMTLSQRVALDPGDNVIEVVAFTDRNLLASPPARTNRRSGATTGATKPNLYVLAIGINAYTDAGWTPPGRSEPEQFAPLGLAVADTMAFVRSVETAASPLYGTAKIVTVLDGQATRSGIEAAISQIAREMHPRDTLLLYAAAHGISRDGRFYIIPQDYQHGPDALARDAIGQDVLQDWLANRIKAKHALILLDTCESGALVAGQLRSRANVPASEAALGRLHEATGRPVLTAAASGKPALEGYQGHGVFTWALMDALRNGDADGNGVIDLLELVTHVQALVPRISAELQGTGRAAMQIRQPTAEMQSARFGSRGENFPIVRRLP